MNPIALSTRPVNAQTALQGVARDSVLLRQENTALETSEKGRLEAQIAKLIEERDQAKRSNTRLKTKLEDARERERVSQRKFRAIEECKPRALWADVLVPMLELELPGGIPGIMQVDIRHPSPAFSNTVIKEQRRFNTATNEPFSESRKTVLKGTNSPILKISFYAQSGNLREEIVKREEPPCKKRKY